MKNTAVTEHTVYVIVLKHVLHAYFAIAAVALAPHCTKHPSICIHDYSWRAVWFNPWFALSPVRSVKYCTDYPDTINLSVDEIWAAIHGRHFFHRLSNHLIANLRLIRKRIRWLTVHLNNRRDHWQFDNQCVAFPWAPTAKLHLIMRWNAHSITIFIEMFFNWAVRAPMTAQKMRLN